MKKIFFALILFSQLMSAQDLIEAANKAQAGSGRQAYKDAIAKNQNLFNTCYKKHIKIPPKIPLALVVEWQVDDIGAVRFSKIKRSNFPNDEFESCVADKIKEIEFPATPSGQLINIVYTLFFDEKSLKAK